ncbi:aromatic amino acid transaminase [Erwinia sp. AnSW2-5]|uniref:amino acid aminotransferase n=1 Tax=Erwinia sp. AnSW2-5 TaxID=3367692 RepID=UPI00385C08F1
MLNKIEPSLPDPIMSLMEAYTQDPHADKVNLGIGLYYDHQGNIPVMQAVKIAEQRLVEQQRPHTYPPIEGAPLYANQVQTLLLGQPMARVATVQSVGGSGALKLAADFLYHALSRREIWVSDPTWSNHWAIFEGAGLQVKTYPYFDDNTGLVSFDAMMGALSCLPTGAVVLLHPCCHNPTGSDLTPSQWRSVIDLMHQRRLLPFFDIAYQGFGEGLEEDSFALRETLKTDLDFLVSHSFSKNLALYGERLGSLSICCASPSVASNVKGMLKTLIRRSYSCPPIHGSQIVETVFADPALYQNWVGELAAMRQRIRQMRISLSAALELQGASLDYARIRNQKGMFSYTGLNESQIGQLRHQHAIYLVAPGRMCLPGLNAHNIDYVTAAIVDVTRTTSKR